MDSKIESQTTIDQATKDKAAQEKKVVNSKLFTNSAYMAADAMNALHGKGRLLDLTTVVQELVDSTKKIANGNTKEIENMLIMQAKTLDYIFYDSLNKLVDLNMINQIEVFTNIAFRAQSQSRKTLAILAEIKHPKRTTFIAKQNNAIQVNNAIKSNSEKKEIYNNVTTELNAQVTNETKSMDLRTKITASRENACEESMAALHRSNDTRRQEG